MSKARYFYERILKQQVIGESRESYVEFSSGIRLEPSFRGAGTVLMNDNVLFRVVTSNVEEAFANVADAGISIVEPLARKRLSGGFQCLDPDGNWIHVVAE